ncbi:MAG TPA: DUF2339 domain-containing protein [Actinomycetota bacterium]|nr:DUF2339 domain-containing protein [Actinomycetota bacterium]
MSAAREATMGAEGGPSLGAKELDDLRTAVAGLEHDLGVVKGILYRTTPPAAAPVPPFPAPPFAGAPVPAPVVGQQPGYPPPQPYPAYVYAPYQYARPKGRPGQTAKQRRADQPPGQAYWPPQPVAPPPQAERPPQLRVPLKGAEAEASYAGTWSARIGVLAVLLGAAFAFKYGIDRGLIGPALRVVVGFLAGLGFVAWGWWARRKTWERFAQAVTAGGIAICYLSILVADLAYHLVSSPVALVVLVVITAGNAALAALYDSLALGIMATVGGFLDPLLVATHQPAAASLYPYVTVLDLGVLLFAHRTGWRALPVIARVGTWILFGVGMVTASVGLGLAYCGAFLVLFSAVPLVRALRTKEPARTDFLDVYLLAAHTLAAFALGHALLVQTHHTAWVGAFTFGLAGVLTALGLIATAIARRDELLQSALYGLGAAAAVVAVPLRFHDFALGLAWGIEGLVFAAGALLTRTRYCVRVGTLVTGTGGLVVFSFLFQAYRPAHLLVSPSSASVLGVVAALAAEAWLSGRDAAAGGPDRRFWHPWTALAACGLTILWMTAEAVAHYHDPLPTAAAWQPMQFTISAIWGLSAAAMLGAGFSARLRWARLGALALLGLTVAKMLVMDLWTLSTGQRVLGFIGMGVVLLACSLSYHRFKDLVLGTGRDPQAVAPAS